MMEQTLPPNTQRWHTIPVTAFVLTEAQKGTAVVLLANPPDADPVELSITTFSVN